MMPSSRGRPRGRRYGASLLVVCVGVFCVLLLLVEIRESDLASSSTATALSSGSEDHGTFSTLPPKHAAAGPAVEGGLWRAASFKSYVEMARAEEGTPLMPVVTRGDENVTIPSLIIIGARRAGTTSLFRMLGQHPDVASIVPEVYVRGSQGLMAQDPSSYPRRAEWPGDRLETDLPADVLGNVMETYARPFILSEAREKGATKNLVTTELSPGYMSSPLAPYRLKVAFPDVKIVLILRDPVDRYFSELRTKMCVGHEESIDWEDIEGSFADVSASKSYLSEAVVNYSPYDRVCLGEGASAADLWNCQQASQRSHRPLLDGLYAGQIARWLRAFTRSQVKIVDSTLLFSNPQKTAADVAKFVGLDEHHFIDHVSDRDASCDPRQRSSKISAAYYKRKEAEPNFRKWYADHNDMVAEVVGKDYNWNERIRSMHPTIGSGL